MNTNTDNTPVSTTEQAELMIVNQDWDGLIHQLQQHTEIKTKADDNGIKETISILTSNNRLPRKLLKEQTKDSESAKTLFLMLVALGGRDFVMRGDFYLGKDDKEEDDQNEDEDEDDIHHGTLLHAVAKFNSCVEIVLNLIEVAGRDLVFEKCAEYNWHSLQYACQYKASIDVVLALIEVGGRDLVLENDNWNGWNSLHIALHYNTSLDIILKLIEVGGRDLVLQKDSNSWNSFVYACEGNAPTDAMKKIIEVGGRDLVVDKDEHDRTSLHYACKHNASIDVVEELISVGGLDLVLQKDRWGNNSLHYACQYKAPIDVVKKLIEVGRWKLAWDRDRYGRNSLHVACENNASIDVVKELTGIGGWGFVWQEGHGGRTSLHCACKYNASIDVVRELIKVGGQDIITKKDSRGRISLHCVCYNGSSMSCDVLDLLIQRGGRDVLTQVDNEGKTPLHVIIRQYWRGEEQKRALIEKVSFLINKGIELQIGGQHSFGGLFSHSVDQDVLNEIPERNWDENVLPALEQVMAQPHNRHLPILQAFIVNKAPSRIIKSAVNNFTNSINITDSLGKYPIDVAIDNNLSWDDGMEQIVEALASLQQTTPFNICLKHGVQWENGTRTVLESNGMDVVSETVDTSTGLYPFMMAAAVGGKHYRYDLDSIFHLMKAFPHLVKRN